IRRMRGCTLGADGTWTSVAPARAHEASCGSSGKPTSARCSCATTTRPIFPGSNTRATAAVCKNNGGAVRSPDRLRPRWPCWRACQDTDRAFRQYNAVEPENRLVARTLERKWEEALLGQRALEEEYARFQQTQPTRLSAAERAQIERLAQDLPAVWQAPGTSVV